MKDGKYYIHILDGIVKDSESGEDVTKEFGNLNELGLKLGLDVDGDIFYVKKGIQTRGVHYTAEKRKNNVGKIKQLFGKIKRWFV